MTRMNKIMYNFLEEYIISYEELFDSDSKLFAIKICENDFKYLEENYKKIQKIENQNECLIISAAYSNNINILIFIIQIFKLNINVVNIYGHNCLVGACCFNHNLEIIKYLVEGCNMNPCLIDKLGDNCLILSCHNNPNLEIIKYLVEECKIELNTLNIDGRNCLMEACNNNPNLDLIL